MILFELLGAEQHPVYQALEVSNGNRQYDFLSSIVDASLKVGRPFLSEHIIKALNFQAITCLHTNAGEYRPCQVTVGTYTPPEHYRVSALMEDFVNTVNRNWESTDPVTLAAYVLWRLNFIHPFINGNGRTARAASYFVLCLKANTLLPGTTILPELLRREHDAYVLALQKADQLYIAGDPDPLADLRALLEKLINEQLATAGAGAQQGASPDAPLQLPAPQA